MELLKRQSCFSGQNIPNGNSHSISSFKAIFDDSFRPSRLFSRNRTDLGSCVIFAPLAKYWLTLLADTQSTCRPCLPTLGCHIKRHISRILVDLSANMSTNKLADGVGQYVDRQSGDISIDTPPTFRRYFTATQLVVHFLSTQIFVVTLSMQQFLMGFGGFYQS